MTFEVFVHSICGGMLGIITELSTSGQVVISLGIPTFSVLAQGIGCHGRLCLQAGLCSTYTIIIRV